jgi:hypothetical protein
MVLLEIDPTSVAVLKFERDAPGSVDVNRIALRIKAMQRVKVEAWDVHFLSSDGDVETVKSRENALVHFRIDLRTPAPRPQLRKGFALEGTDHTTNVSK